MNNLFVMYKKSINMKILCLLVISLLSSCGILFGQKNVDLQMSIESPQNDEVIDYGDTLYLKINVKNIGPDTLFMNSDTFYYVSSAAPISSSNWADLNPGDSAVFDFMYMVNDGHVDDQTQDICIYFLPYSNSFVDTNATNDTSCVSYTLKGSQNDVGIDNVQLLNDKINIYPNPAREHVFINFNLARKERIHVRLYDIIGRQIIHEQKDLPKGEHSISLDILELNPGIYWLKCYTSEGLWVQKLSIIK